MRILFISSGNTKNGISPLVESQGKSLMDIGQSVDFFTIKGKGFKGYFKGILQLRSLLKAKKYDLLHAHYGLSGIIGFLSKGSLPLVISFMGDDILGSNDSQGGTTISSKILSKINRFLASRYYSYTIVKSPQMQNILSISKSGVIPNGVNLKEFYPRDKNTCRKELGLELTDRIIAFISNPERPEKNFKLADNAVSRLNKENVKLMAVYGKNQQEINSWLNAADLLILTSYHEGSPNIIKEAMACNCPIVSTDVGDVSMVIRNINGCYLSAYDSKELSNKIDQALEFSQTIGRTKGRQRIIDIKLDSFSIANRILDIYKNILKD